MELRHITLYHGRKLGEFLRQSTKKNLSISIHHNYDRDILTHEFESLIKNLFTLKVDNVHIIDFKNFQFLIEVHKAILESRFAIDEVILYVDKEDGFESYYPDIVTGFSNYPSLRSLEKFMFDSFNIRNLKRLVNEGGTVEFKDISISFYNHKQSGLTVAINSPVIKGYFNVLNTFLSEDGYGLNVKLNNDYEIVIYRKRFSLNLRISIIYNYSVIAGSAEVKSITIDKNY